MTYNLTNVTNSTNLLEFMSASNDLTGGFMFLGITGVLFVILFIGLINRGIIPAIAVSTWVTGLTGILFIVTGLISTQWLAFYILPMALGAGFTWIASRGDT
jgi:hypothetical protein